MTRPNVSKSPLLDLEVYPPFDGFPKEGVAFLKLLKKNNNRRWFATHRSEYEDFVKLPMQSLIAALQYRVVKFAPEMDVNPKRSMFRIYRDTRFSRNKTPYKTHVAAVFHVKGHHWGKSAGYYVHIEPGKVYVGGGIYMPDGKQLKKIRKAIADDSRDFLAIVSSDRFARRFKSLEGESLQRMPLGFPADHMMAKWLKYKQFYTGVAWDEKECYTERFVDKIVSVYKDLLPFIRFLNGALGM